MDLIGKIYPSSSKGHCFILVATDYFSKWVEAVPLKKAEQKDVIQFIKEHLIHRFGIPEPITTNQGTMFTGDEMQEFTADYGSNWFVPHHITLRLMAKLRHLIK